MKRPKWYFRLLEFVYGNGKPKKSIKQKLFYKSDPKDDLQKELDKLNKKKESKEQEEFLNQVKKTEKLK